MVMFFVEQRSDHTQNITVFFNIDFFFLHLSELHVDKALSNPEQSYTEDHTLLTFMSPTPVVVSANGCVLSGDSVSLLSEHIKFLNFVSNEASLACSVIVTILN